MTAKKAGLKMTRWKLSRLVSLKGLIRRTEDQITIIRDRLNPHGVNLSGMPRNSSPKNAVEENVAKLVDLQEKLKAYRREAEEIEQFIGSVDDYQIRLILQLRYVDAKEWNEVADFIGGNNTESSVKKMCYRFLKKTEKEKSKKI